MGMRIACWIVLLTAPAALMAAPAGELVANGGFEEGSSGWDLQGAALREMPDLAVAGRRVLELDPASAQRGTAAFKVWLTPGMEYRLTYSLNAPDLRNAFVCSYLNPEGPGDQPYAILDQYTAGHTYGDPKDLAIPYRKAGWRKRSITFIAERPDNTLRFGPATRWSGGTCGKLLLDEVHLAATARKAEYGRDYEYRAVLPSEAVVGRPVRLVVSAVYVIQSFRYGTPTGLAHELRLACDDEKAALPGEVNFPGGQWAVKEMQATFSTPGVHRIRVGDAASNEALSNPVRVTAEAPPVRHFWGDIHIHTRYQHGGERAGDVNDNYRFARDVSALDFAALSEHYARQVTPEVWVEKMGGATRKFNEPGRFVTLLGIETGSWQGHHNFYLRGSDPLEMFDRRERPGSTEGMLDFFHHQKTPLQCIPHHGALLQPTDWRIADRDDCRVVEIYSNHGSSEEPGEWWRAPAWRGPGNFYGDSGAVRGCTWRDALARGRRLGCIGSGDGHSARPGLTGLACVVTDSLRRERIFDAVGDRRCYATTSQRILMDFSINDAVMGQEAFVAPGTPLKLHVAANACDRIERIEVVSEGEVVTSVKGDGAAMDLTSTLDLGEFDGAPRYYYLRLLQAVGHRAWTSPIWILPAATSDLCLERKDFSYDYAQRTLTINARNYGDAPARASLSLYSAAKEPLLGRVEMQGKKCGVTVRVEPINDHACMLRIVVHAIMRKGVGGTEGGGEFACSGKVALTGAKAAAVTLDPRGVLKHTGDELTWSDNYGMFFKWSQSRSSAVSDMAIRVETTDKTTAEVSVEIDGAPTPLLALGSGPAPKATTATIPLGGIAKRALVAQRDITVAPDGPTGRGILWAITRPDLAPGVTYVAVLDGDDAVREIDERNNVCAFDVPATPVTYNPWPEFRKTGEGRNK